MKMTLLAAERSTCERRKVGAVIVKDRHILATGYNGAPTGVSHCASAGCLRAMYNIPSGERHEICRGAHAEPNAVGQAAKYGTAIDGATIYITNFPCAYCAKLLINAGIVEIVYKEAYANDELALELLNEAKITLTHFTE
jgi:dCMP deaminase